MFKILSYISMGVTIASFMCSCFFYEMHFIVLGLIGFTFWYALDEMDKEKNKKEVSKNE